MPRSNQGMLAFPEDNEAAPPEAPWTVSELNHEVRACLEGQLGKIWVQGEISNLRRQPSGHQYFSLKDEAAQVSCVLFRSAGAGAPALRDGDQQPPSKNSGPFLGYFHGCNHATHFPGGMGWVRH